MTIIALIGYMRRNYLKQWLERKNISQVDLSNKIGMDKINFNKIVNNKRNLEIDLAEKIANIFGIHWSILYQDQPHRCKIHGFARRDWTVELVNPLKHTEQYVTFNSIATIDLNNVIVIEEVGFFALHLFDKKPQNYPCQAINLIEDGKNNWFMSYYKTSKKDHDAYGDKTYEEYDYENFYYPKSGLAYWETNKQGYSVETTHKIKKDYTYYHIICTEFDATYDVGFHYRDKPKGIKI